MIDAARVAEIIKQYEKHGWTLRRVLLCAKTREILSASSSSPENLFSGVTVAESEISAVWFSRASTANGNEAWELRRLTGAPLAFIEVFGATDDETARERKRREIETKMHAK